MNKRLEAMVKTSWFRKGFSLLLAFGLWWRTQLSVDKKQMFFDVPVIISNLPEGKQLCPEKYASQRYTHLALKGKKHILDQVDSSDLRVVLDLSELHDKKTSHSIHSNNIYWHERPITECANLRTAEVPNVQITLLDQITTTATIDVVMPPSWKDRVLAYTPSCFEQAINTTELNMRQQDAMGFFWTVPESLLQQGYDQSFFSNMDEGVVIPLAPEHRLMYLPAIAKEPKIIADPKLSKIRLFFIPNAQKKEGISVRFRNICGITGTEDLSFLSSYQALLPLTQSISVTGASPLVLKDASEHLFLDAQWSSGESLCLSLSIVHLLQWEEKFLDLYAKKMHNCDEISEEDVRKIGKKLFAHYLFNLHMDNDSIHDVQKRFRSHPQLARVTIYSG